MANRILTDSQRAKEDNNDDLYFYAEARFVHHLDEGFRNRLTKLYRDRISAKSVVLDLMSSWVSHLPDQTKYKKVIGHGLNTKELEFNKRLDTYWIQNLNIDYKLPLDDSSVDCCLMVAAWQYLQYPEEIALELKRVIKSGGQLIISFSNRAFWSKAPRIWTEGSDIDHINYISDVLISQDWNKPEYIFDNKNSFLDLLKGHVDPFLSVIATND